VVQSSFFAEEPFTTSKTTRPAKNEL